MSSGNVPPEFLSAQSFFALLLIFVIVFLSMTWAAISWHRYGLLSEDNGKLFTAVNRDLIWAYAGASVRLFLVIFLWLFIIALMGFMLLGVLHLQVVFLDWLMLVVTTFFTAQVMRYSLILPAAALGKRLSLGEAVRATKGRFGMFFGLAVCLTIFSVVTNVTLGSSPAGLAVAFFSRWINFAVGLSIVTTLYGVCIENRELNTRASA